MANDYLETHRQRLEEALQAISTRGYWSAFPEVPSGKIYGETAKADGAEAFKARLGTPWAVEQPGTASMVGSEVSPFGMDLGISPRTVEIHRANMLSKLGAGSSTEALRMYFEDTLLNDSTVDPD